jgi:hypothetical protein
MNEHETPNSSEKSLAMRKSQTWDVVRVPGARLLFDREMKRGWRFAESLQIAVVTPLCFHKFLCADGKLSEADKHEVLAFVDEFEAGVAGYVDIPNYCASTTEWMRRYFCHTLPDAEASSF